MDPWSLSNYRSPRLRVESIGRSDDGLAVILTRFGNTYNLRCDSSEEAASLELALVEWRSSDAIGMGNEELGEVGSYLDSRGLVGEADNGNPSDNVTTAFAELRSRIAAAVDWTQTHTNHSSDALRIQASTLLYRYRRQNGSVAFEFDATVALNNTNFYSSLLDIEMLFLHDAFPIGFEASLCLISALITDLPAQHSLESTLKETYGLWEMRDVESHLTLVTHCLSASIQAGASRLPSPPPFDFKQSMTGSDFIRRAENYTRMILELWGTNRYLASVENAQHFNSPAIVGCYIEEYHVTRRFVEIIAPLLHKRLARPLRELMSRYYNEEVGHERFERATCEELGVDGVILDNTIPLPLHVAFIDSLTLASETDPTAFFTMIMVTEGMIGDGSPLSEKLLQHRRLNPRFGEVSRKHEELNQNLNHASIARHVFSEISSLSIDRQRTAIAWLMFLLEVNHRAWNLVADFYGEQDTLQFHNFLGTAKLA